MSNIAFILALPPKLGSRARNRIAGLAGLAPRNCENSVFAGRRRVCGGRSKVRRILYLCAARYHRNLRTFYLRLRTVAKAPKKMPSLPSPESSAFISRLP